MTENNCKSTPNQCIHYHDEWFYFFSHIHYGCWTISWYYSDIIELFGLQKSSQFSKNMSVLETSRIYSDLKLWLKAIELPYVGHTSGLYYRITSKEIVHPKVWSMLLPPENSKALENVLEKMALSEESIQRFQLVEKVCNKDSNFLSNFLFF